MNVKFVKLQEKHLEMVRNWRNNPEVAKYMYTEDFISKEEQIRWFDKINTDKTKKYWILSVDDKFVGVVNLYNIDNKNKRCYWAYYIADPSVRGKGIGKIVELNVIDYVFSVLKLNKLCCEVLGFNRIVVEIHKKYGSKIEGKFKQHIFKKGKFHDIYCMAILNEEWNQIKDKFEYLKVEIG